MSNPANLEIKNITLQLQAPKLWKNWVNYHKRGVFNFIFIKITYRCTPGLTVELVGREGGGGLMVNCLRTISNMFIILCHLPFSWRCLHSLWFLVCADTSCYIYTQDTMWLSLSKTHVKYNWKCICYILFSYCFVFWVFFSISVIFFNITQIDYSARFLDTFYCKLFFPFSKFKFFFYKTKLCWCIIFSKISFMYIWIFNVVTFFKKFKIIYIKSLTAWSFNCFKLQIFWQSPWVKCNY